MNAMSASRADPSENAKAPGRILVWDAPVRVFHWLIVLSFAGAWLTAESEPWRLLHVTLGYTMAGLVVFRIIWGLVGTRHARFSSFVRGPAAVTRYLLAMLRGRPEHHVGHNPAGALAIVVMLGLALAIGVSGWAVFHDAGGEWLEEAHEMAAYAMLAVVGIHVAAVMLSSWMHRENLVGAMVSGRKPGRPEDGARSAWRSVAVLMLTAVLAFWWMQWEAAPSAGEFPERQVAAAKAKDLDRDHD